MPLRRPRALDRSNQGCPSHIPQRTCSPESSLPERPLALQPSGDPRGCGPVWDHTVISPLAEEPDPRRPFGSPTRGGQSGIKPLVAFAPPLQSSRGLTLFTKLPPLPWAPPWVCVSVEGKVLHPQGLWQRPETSWASLATRLAIGGGCSAMREPGVFASKGGSACN